NVGYFMDTCYEVESNGDRFRGSLCDSATNYGQVRGITWNDPRSAFRSLHRGLYFKPGDLNNAAGPTTWYTDPFGGNARTSAFTGSVRQYLGAEQVNYGQRFGGSEVPEVVDRVHDSGGGTVHAPN